MIFLIYDISLLSLINNGEFWEGQVQCQIWNINFPPNFKFLFKNEKGTIQAYARL